jgi:hypothetical protein
MRNLQAPRPRHPYRKTDGRSHTLLFYDVYFHNSAFTLRDPLRTGR